MYHVSRNANSPEIFIPLGFGESGNGFFLFLGVWRNLKLFPGLSGISGNCFSIKQTIILFLLISSEDKVCSYL